MCCQVQHVRQVQGASELRPHGRPELFRKSNIPMPTKTMPGCHKKMPTPWQVAAAAQLRESRVERSTEHCAACSACCRQVLPCIDTHQSPRYPQCTPTPLTLAISGPNKQASNTFNFQTPVTGTAHKSAVTFITSGLPRASLTSISAATHAFTGSPTSLQPRHTHHLMHLKKYTTACTM